MIRMIHLKISQTAEALGIRGPRGPQLPQEFLTPWWYDFRP